MTAEPSPAGSLVLIRHGETEWSSAGKHTSTTDVALTEHGQQQARALRPVLRSRTFALILVSPRERARATAELAGLSDVRIDADAVEWDYGDYEGRTTDQIRRDRPGWTIFTGDPAGGETAAAVGARADRLLGRILPALADGDVAVVGHGHFGRVLAARYLRLPVAAGALLRLEPATISILGHEHESPTIEQWNVPPEGAR
jgi:broad specificity phosphatase PhoE